MFGRAGGTSLEDDARGTTVDVGTATMGSVVKVGAATLGRVEVGAITTSQVEDVGITTMGFVEVVGIGGAEGEYPTITNRTPKHRGSHDRS